MKGLSAKEEIEMLEEKVDILYNLLLMTLEAEDGLKTKRLLGLKIKQSAFKKLHVKPFTKEQLDDLLN